MNNLTGIFDHLKFKWSLQTTSVYSLGLYRFAFCLVSTYAHNETYPLALYGLTDGLFF